MAASVDESALSVMETPLGVENCSKPFGMDRHTGGNSLRCCVEIRTYGPEGNYV